MGKVIVVGAGAIGLLMARLLAALPEGARLILLGDKDQLSSVEAGAVLGDICGLSRSSMSPEQGRWLARLTGYDLAPWCQASGPALRDRICLLRKSWRFDGQSGIGRLARAVNLGQTAQVAALLDSPPADLAFHGEEDRLSALLAAAVAGYRPYLDCLARGPCDAERAAQALALFNRCRVLCAVRDGSWGGGPRGGGHCPGLAAGRLPAAGGGLVCGPPRDDHAKRSRPGAVQWRHRPHGL
ncbi:MAG: AAA family ATPase [Aeromonadaceae bacterium]|nr:AAA family ATPase [Aeromonadaceae bacterium]